jgi:pimeloyl-ACP methyl ester carboxylesterase
MPATPDLDALGIQHHFANVNGIRMHYVECGSGEPVVMLHGFPENWYSWRHQVAALAGTHRVIVPDLRGYNETENRGPYDTDTLQADVLGLIEAVGESRVHLVAHDWGGALAWLIAIGHPAVLRSLTVCNLPHPALFERGLRRPSQMLRSWYVLFFQLPWLPERMLAARGYQQLARMLIRDCQPGTFTRDDIRFYLRSWQQHGLRGGINWYRALVRHPKRLPSPPPMVTTPTLLIWGEDDRALSKELTFGTDEYVEELRIEYLPGVSHWVQQEAPAEVNRLLRQHIAEHRGI